MGPTTAKFYERSYDAIASSLPPAQSVGGGDFDTFGRIELAILKHEGLRPSDTVVDFGCGTGRLAVHLIPYLEQGRYVGIDISKKMLEEAARRSPRTDCSVEFKHQVTPQFDLPDAFADLMCAFSVFTHMEAEDSYRYLLSASRVVKRSGKLILSCLPLSLPIARKVFLDSANLELADRWAQARNVVTTEETMETIATMAGWKLVHWRRGDQPVVADLPPLGQSTCVLELP
jgi:ubiquinone/menaquinone biosynthesis C-methylase UbiE